jgi:DnaJ family protein A protein 2
MVSILNCCPPGFHVVAETRGFIGAVKVILGQGMPSHRHHDLGDLFVNLHVKFPNYIDPSAIALLEQALPPRDPLPKFSSSIATEEVELQEMDARQKHNYSKGGDSMDEDEDGQARVQCANQ